MNNKEDIRNKSPPLSWQETFAVGHQLLHPVPNHFHSYTLIFPIWIPSSKGNKLISIYAQITMIVCVR